MQNDDPYQALGFLVVVIAAALVALGLERVAQSTKEARRRQGGMQVRNQLADIYLAYLPTIQLAVTFIALTLVFLLT